MRHCNAFFSLVLVPHLFSFLISRFSSYNQPFPPFPCVVCDSALLFRRRVSQMAYSKRPSQNWAQSIACNSFGPLSDGLRAATRRLGPPPATIRESPYRLMPYGPATPRATATARARVRPRPWTRPRTRPRSGTPVVVPVPAWPRCIKNVQQIRKKVRQQIVVAKHLLKLTKLNLKPNRKKTKKNRMKQNNTFPISA